MRPFEVAKHAMIGVTALINQLGAELVKLKVPRQLTDPLLLLVARASTKSSFAVREAESADQCYLRMVQDSKGMPRLQPFAEPTLQIDKIIHYHQQMEQYSANSALQNHDRGDDMISHKHNKQTEEQVQQENQLQNDVQKVKVEGQQHVNGQANNSSEKGFERELHKTAQKKPKAVSYGQTGNRVAAGPAATVLAFLLNVKTRRRLRGGKVIDQTDATTTKDDWECCHCHKTIICESEYLECDDCGTVAEPIRYHKSCLLLDTMAVDDNVLKLACCQKNIHSKIAPPTQAKQVSRN